MPRSGAWAERGNLCDSPYSRRGAGRRPCFAGRLARRVGMTVAHPANSSKNEEANHCLPFCFLIARKDRMKNRPQEGDWEYARGGRDAKRGPPITGGRKMRKQDLIRMIMCV